jgi:hypothetical protein
MAATYVASRSPGDADDETGMLLQVPESLVNIDAVIPCQTFQPSSGFSTI